jgi:hypothetical protein
MLLSFFGNGHGKGPRDEARTMIKGFCIKNNSIPKLESYKMLKRSFNSYMNSCPLDLNHHIMVQ